MPIREVRRLGVRFAPDSRPTRLGTETQGTYNWTIAIDPADAGV
jgi:hypothetical protein